MVIYVVVQFYPWFNFSFLLFHIHYHILTYEQRKIKIEPRIKLNYNICMQLVHWPLFSLCFHIVRFWNGFLLMADFIITSRGCMCLFEGCAQLSIVRWRFYMYCSCNQGNMVVHFVIFLETSSTSLAVRLSQTIRVSS